MKIFYDTEFLERGPEHPIHFISIGLVRDDGAEYYAVSSEMKWQAVRAHPWISQNVWPHLPLKETRGGRCVMATQAEIKHPAKIAREVQGFVLGVPDPELWAAWCAYDHVVLCQLFGCMIDLPDRFPMYTNDLKSYSNRLGNPKWPAQTEPEHHALHDARHDRAVWKFLRGIELGAHVAEAPR